MGEPLEMARRRHGVTVEVGDECENLDENVSLKWIMQERDAVAKGMRSWTEPRSLARKEASLSGEEVDEEPRGGVDDTDVKGWELWLRQHAVIPPESGRKFAWDLFIILLVLYNAVIIPVYFGFLFKPPAAQQVLDTIVDCFFGVDIVLSFRTGYIREDGIMVVDTRMIARKYLRGWFAIDFLATFPFEVFVNAVGGGGSEDATTTLQIVGALKCVRLLRLGRIFKML